MQKTNYAASTHNINTFGAVCRHASKHMPPVPLLQFLGTCMDVWVSFIHDVAPAKLVALFKEHDLQVCMPRNGQVCVWCRFVVGSQSVRP